MAFQYTYDTNGKPLGVFVPLNEWEKITTILKTRTTTRGKKKKNNALSSILKGLKQVREIEQGEMKSITLKELLNEL
jgi:hypothetical protein